MKKTIKKFIKKAKTSPIQKSKLKHLKGGGVIVGNTSSTIN